jgi:hypothetical protein
MDLLEHSSVILACDNCRYSCSTVGHATFAAVGKPCPACGGGRFIEYVSAADFRGAVEAADEVVAELCALAEEQPGNPHDGLSTRLYAIAHKLERGQGRRP